MFVPYALVLLQKDNKILLLRRGSVNFGAGLFHLPGGKVEANETARQAAVRETQEELGVSIKPEDLKLTHVFNRKGKTEEIIALIFQADNWQGTPSIQEPDKHEELAWFELNKLPTDIIPAHAQAIKLITQKINYSEHGW